MIHVYDSSFVGSLIIPDEKIDKSEKYHDAVGKNDEIFTPQLFWYEIANLLKNLIRRKRYTYEEALKQFSPLSKVQLITDFETGIAYCKKLLFLANEYNLSSYDASYLELAERKKAVLCTYDDDLRAAAKKHGVLLMK